MHTTLTSPSQRRDFPASIVVVVRTPADASVIDATTSQEE